MKSLRAAGAVAGTGLVIFALVKDRIGVGGNVEGFGYMQVAMLVAGLLIAGWSLFHKQIAGAVVWIVHQEKNATLVNLSMMVLTLVVMFAGLEVAVRMIGTVDRYGQFRFLDQPIRPFAVPVEKIDRMLADYQSSSNSYLLYDPLLGWTIRPNVQSGDRYRSNANGMRADHDFTLEPAPGVTRIALFGDSFTHGDDVDLDESWAILLENRLRADGYNVEVLNFGVGGYGMDQAYLRWKLEGRDYQPDLVVFGFQPENITRNLNIVRVMYLTTTNIPFLKPRFVLEDGQLVLVDSPTPPPDEIPDLLRHFGDSPLVQYEAYYEKYHVRHWWQASRLLSVIADTMPVIATDLPSQTKVRHPSFYRLDSEPMMLALAIVRQFKADVAADGTQFMVLHLPHYEYLEAYRETGRMPHAELLDALDSEMTLVRTEGAFVAPNLNDYYVGKGHYNPEGNALIADQAADAIEALLDR